MASDNLQTQGAPDWPRVGTAIAVIALGCGIGFTLMLAKVFVIVGLVFSLIPTLVVLALYWSIFKLAYSALRSSNQYTGNVKELLAILVTSITIIPISIAVFLVESKEEPILNHALMAFQNVAFEQRGPDLFFVKVHTANIGNLTAKNLLGIYIAALVDIPKHPSDPPPLSKDIIDYQIQTIVNILNELDKLPERHGVDIIPTGGAYYDAAASGSINSIADIKPENTYKVNAEMFKHWVDGTKLLYVIYAERYDDDAVDGYWQIKSCSFSQSMSASTYSHTCLANKTERISKRRSDK